MYECIQSVCVCVCENHVRMHTVCVCLCWKTQGNKDSTLSQCDTLCCGEGVSLPSAAHTAGDEILCVFACACVCVRGQDGSGPPGKVCG